VVPPACMQYRCLLPVCNTGQCMQYRGGHFQGIALELPASNGRAYCVLFCLSVIMLFAVVLCVLLPLALQTPLPPRPWQQCGCRAGFWR